MIVFLWITIIKNDKRQSNPVINTYIYYFLISINGMKHKAHASFDHKTMS